MSSFLHTRSLLVPCVYVSIESIDYILLLLLALETILLTSSVNTLCFSLLNICCYFNINLFFMNYSRFFLKLSTSTLFFFLVSSFYFQVKVLLNSVYNL